MIMINMLNVLLVKDDIMDEHKKFSRDMKGEERRGQNNYFRHMAEKAICKIQKAEEHQIE